MKISSFLWSLFFPAPHEMEKVEMMKMTILEGEANFDGSSIVVGKCVPQIFCFYGKLDQIGLNIEFTVHSISKGWTSIGVTTTESMVNATLFMGWQNSTGGYTIADRISIDHVMPLPSTHMSSTAIPLKIPLPSWANSGFSFTRPLVSDDVSITKDLSFIYAFGNKPPLGNIDLPIAKFRIHGFNDCGSLGVVDFISPPPATSTTSLGSTSTTPSSTPVPTTTPSSSSTSICASDPNTFCLYGEPDDSGTNIIFTIHSKAGGWAAMGTGDDMSSSAITVGWANSNGGFTISDRVSKEEAMPTVSGSVSSQNVPLHVPKPDWASLAFSFTKPIRNADVVFTEQTHYIFAYSATPPRTVNSPSSSFGRHNKYGVFGPVNFLKKGGGPVPPPTPSPVTTPPTPEPGGDSSGSTSECIPGSFCVYGEPDGKGNVLITIHSSAQGWAGLGIGSSMNNAAMIVGWKNSKGSYTISDRTSTSNSLPSVSTLVSQLVALKHPAPSWANIAFTISRPFAGSITSGSTYIYALSNTKPSNIDSASSSFSKHSSAGSLGVLDFTSAKGTSSPPPSSNGNPGAGGIVSQNTGLGSTCINSLYCVYSEPDGSGNVYITLQTAAKGWVGLGTGSSMDGSVMIVGWSNSSGGVTVSERISKDSVMPTLSSSSASALQIVPLRVEKPGWANLAFTVKRALKSDVVTFTPQTSFIYAYSSRVPASIDSPASTFAIHDGRGQLGVLDFTSVHKGIGSGLNENGGTPPDGSQGEGSPSNDGLLGSTCIPNQFCVYSEPDDKGNVYITLQSSLSGWIGLGTGDSMAGSFMILGWKNSSGGYTVSDRIGTGEVMPNPASTLASLVVPLRVPAPSWAQVSFTVLRPLKTSDFTFTPSTRFIYAVSSKTASSSDDSNSGLQIHENYGLLGILDFTTKHSGVGNTGSSGDSPILKLPDGVEYINVIRIHGYVMIYAWVVCPVVAIFIARYLKSRLGHLWFELHRGIMVVGCFFGTIGGILIIYLFKSGPHFSLAHSVHPLLGLLVGIILVIQIGLGIASDRLFSPDRPNVPWWDKAHWWAGRIVCLLAAINIITGIVFTGTFEAEAVALPVLFGLFIAAGVAAFVYGEKYLGQVHHIKLDDVEEGAAADTTDTLIHA